MHASPPDSGATPASSRAAWLERRATHADAAQDAPKERHNWFLYAFLVLLPLQNVQTGYIPNLGGGFNFLNIGFALSLIGAWRCRGTLTHWSSVHGWILAYILYSLLSLYVGYANVQSETEEHFNFLKDSIVAVLLVFIAQMSVSGWSTLKRVILVTLLPLPYMLRVTWNEHASVSRWHYSDALRISGTFSELGANEFAAFCVSMAIVLFAILLSARLSMKWRLALAAGIACMALGVLWTYSRTAYIALLLGIVSVMLLWRGRWKMLLPLFAAALIAPNFIPVSVIERFDSTTIEEGKRDESTEMRFEFWSIAWNNFTEHPLVGSGYHTFHHHEINPRNMDTHNFFMRELTEKGLIGIFITIGMLLSILRACWRTMRDAPPGSLAYALGLGMVGVWLALMLGNCFGDRFTYYPVIGYFWVYLGLTLKARELVDGGERATPAARVGAPRRFALPRQEGAHV